jgi:5-methylcytosine-specific restriction endonuclease McrA
MPIIRARYPNDWEAIALRIKHEANWCCQQCQRPCRQPSEPLATFLTRVKQWRQQQSPRPAKFEAAPRRYLLTVAHLDQQPSNQDPENLKALCTVCHLKFDSRFRAKQKQLKAEFYGQLSIDDAWQEGLQLSLLPTQIAPFSIPRQGEAPAEGQLMGREHQADAHQERL